MATRAERVLYEHILVHQEGRVGVVQMNRPKALNALNAALMSEVVQALKAFDDDSAIGAMVLTGSERAFAAGADIKEMVGRSPLELAALGYLALWDAVSTLNKPLIAAVSGFCLGGGFELALSCDLIVAAESAMFGQPEINLGVIPGAGGTQRLARAIGKRKAMEMVLSGESINAQEALRLGLVNRLAPPEIYLQEALKLATLIADKAPLAAKLAKESINAIDENHLREGLQRERQNFFLLFSTADQQEGMSAFIEKRQPQWQGK
jgi:enoyl-CoA hydratase